MLRVTQAEVAERAPRHNAPASFMVGRILVKNGGIKAPTFSITPCKVHIGSHLGIQPGIPALLQTRASANSASSSSGWRTRNYRNRKDGPKRATVERQLPPFLRALGKSRRAHCAQPCILLFTRVSLNWDRFEEVLNTHSCPQDQLSTIIMLNPLANQALQLTNAQIQRQQDTSWPYITENWKSTQRKSVFALFFILVPLHLLSATAAERRQTDRLTASWTILLT